MLEWQRWLEQPPLVGVATALTCHKLQPRQMPPGLAGLCCGTTLVECWEIREPEGRGRALPRQAGLGKSS